MNMNDKQVTINVTSEDLLGDGMNSRDCAGYRAVKRVVPDLLYFVFGWGWTTDKTYLQIPKEASLLLHRHMRWQHKRKDYKGDILETEPQQPFSFVMEVPAHIRTID